jgi:hypothetical protein
MREHLTPTDVVERLIGKPDVIGTIAGIDGKAAYQWRTARGFRAAGDIPYAAHMRALLAHSTAHSLGLTAEHLIWGAPEAEIAAILAARDAPAPGLTFTSQREAAA